MAREPGMRKVQRKKKSQVLGNKPYKQGLKNPTFGGVLPTRFEKFTKKPHALKSKEAKIQLFVPGPKNLLSTFKGKYI